MSAVKRKRSTVVKAEPSPPPPTPPPPKALSSHSPSDTLKSWFENPAWSDLTIGLSDGRVIPVHRSVLCSRNEYFDSLCGLKTPAASQNRKAITLTTPNPDAVRGVLRKIYGWDLEQHAELPWQYWFELIKVAAEMLEPELALDAEERLEECAYAAYKADDFDQVCDILHSLHEIEARPRIPTFIKEIVSWTDKPVLANKKFRAYLSGHPKVMMTLLVSRV